MAVCLNTKSALILYQELLNSEYFVDKSDIIEKISRRIRTNTKYVCITKPRRFGKTSALNMFKEYTMLKDPHFDSFFGFTESEVEALCEKQAALSIEDIRDWYNGYQTKDGARLYNPRSVICALEDETCQSYWTRTGKMDEVLFFLKYNIGEVRDDVVKMVNGTSISIDIAEEYAAGQQSPKNREEIYSAMIIYGLLSYYDGELRIPNKELMIEFQKALRSALSR